MKKGSKSFNFSRRLSFTLIAIFAFVLIAVGVFASYPGVRPNPGHTIEEVSAPSGCSANQYLQWTGDRWLCAAIPICSGSNQILHWTGSAFTCYTSTVLTPPPVCIGGQKFLEWSGSNWLCVSVVQPK